METQIKYSVKTLFQYNTTPIGQDGCAFSQSTSNIINTISIINDLNRIENIFGVQFKNTMQNPLFQTFPIMSHNQSDQYLVVSYFDDPVFGTTKNIHTLNYLTDSLFQITPNQSTEHFSSTFGYTYLQNALGVSGNYNCKLTGAIINIDTTGTVYNLPDDLGFEENAKQNTLAFYPNPASNKITINTNLKTIQIYNRLGQLVIEIEKPNVTVNVGQLTKGLYFIKGTDTENRILSSKLIIN